MTAYELIGKKSVAIGTEVFDSELVSDDGVTITVTPSTTEISSFAGTVNVPNGGFDEISASVNLIIPNVQTLMKIFPDLAYPAQFGNGATGQVRFGEASCKSSTAKPIVIHNECDDDSSQDIRIPAGLIQNGGEFDITPGDPIAIEVDITPTKTAEGYVVFGEGSLTQKTLYNPATGKYESIAAATGQSVDEPEEPVDTESLAKSAEPKKQTARKTAVKKTTK